MRYSTEIVQYTLHIPFVDSLTLKREIGYVKLIITFEYCYLGNELFYEEEQVCPDL